MGEAVDDIATDLDELVDAAIDATETALDLMYSIAEKLSTYPTGGSPFTPMELEVLQALLPMEGSAAEIAAVLEDGGRGKGH